MKIYLTIITLLFGLSLSAQTFERTFTFPGDVTPPASIIELNNHYFFTLAVENSNGYYTILYKIGQTGTIIDSLTTTASYYSMAEYKNFIYLFKTENITDTLKVIKVDPVNFNILSHEQYNLKNDLLIHSVSYLSQCNCFSLVGASRDTTGYNTGASIIQLDTNLNLMKEAYYQYWFGPVPSSQGIYPLFYDLLPAPDGNGFWLMANEPVDSLSNWQGTTAAIIPVDSNLVRDSINFKILYSTNHPSPLFSGYWGIMAQPYSGIELTDSTFLFAGREVLDKIPFRLEDDMAYVITDENLNDVRWEFWGGQQNSSSDSAEMSAIGNGISKYNDHVYIAYTSNFRFFYGNTNLYTLRKIDLQGNEIWTKHYSAPLTYDVYSVLATSDGGALISGHIGDPNVPEKNVYLMKVDSMGNRVITSLEKENQEISVDHYKIYPNPVQNELNLLKVNQFKAYTFELYDSFGRLVKTIAWKEDMQQVGVSALSSGLYIYRIIDQEGNVGSGKVVVN